MKRERRNLRFEMLSGVGKRIRVICTEYPCIYQNYSSRNKTELCKFSGAKIYPGKGIRFIRSDSQVFLFANSKCKRYFHNRLKPSKLTWTAMYRKQHKKDIAAEAVKKKRRATKKPYSRSIVGATLEVIQKRRTEKPEVRDAAREAALREIKERIKKTKDEKKAKKAETMSKSQKSQVKSSVPKGAAPKGPKLGGGGGKR
ncbi:60S ribosomal protein L24-1 [Citrus sinensis]|nr:60S ribosomal protein L24-1 [Citrus sinensis]